MKRTVISWKSLPVPMPLQSTFLTYLLLDKFHASQLVYGVAITLGVILWIAYFYSVATSDYVDIFEKPE